MNKNLNNRLRQIQNRYRRNCNESRLDGGPGSGNWGHAGVPGQLGGSAKGSGGVGNRYTDKSGNYTSYAKMKHSMAKAHQTNTEELKKCPKGAKLITKDGTFTKLDGTKWMSEQTGEVVGSYTLNHNEAWDTDVKIALPKEGADVEAYMKEHGATKSSAASSKSSKTNGNFKDSYTQEQVSKATVHSQKDADDTYRDEAGKIWKNSSASEKESLYEYTAGSSFVNEPLRGQDYLGGKSMNGEQAIHDITNTIDKTAGLKSDTILNRGLYNEVFAKMMKISPSDMSKVFNDPSMLVGMVGKEDAFMSTGLAVGKGFSRPIMMEIFAPEGTKGMYVEPFSCFGDGDGKKWNGESKQTTFSYEQEYLLQRGTSVVITAAEMKGGTLHVKCCVTGQDYSDNPPEKWKKHLK